MPTSPRRPKRKTAEPDYLDASTLIQTDRKTKKKKGSKNTKVDAKKKAKAALAKKKAKKQAETYEVASIEDFRKVGKDKKRIQFEVKWKGYDETTWEPMSNLNAQAKKEAMALLERVEGEGEAKTNDV